MKIKELLSGPEKWTKGHAAINAAGVAVSPYSADACCWCLIGALNKCYPDSPSPERDRAFGLLIENFSTEPISIWNDAPERTFAEVKELVEKLDI